MILDAGDQVHKALDQPWLNKVVDTLADTWNAQPLGARWTIGVVVVLALAGGMLKPFLEGVAAVVAAFRKGK